MGRLIDGRAAVLQTASVAARLNGKMVLDDLSNDRAFSSVRTYRTAELDNILFTKELHRRCHSRGISAAAVNPGNVASDFGTQADARLVKFIATNRAARAMLATPEEGADQLIWLADGRPEPVTADSRTAFLSPARPALKSLMATVRQGRSRGAAPGAHTRRVRRAGQPDHDILTFPAMLFNVRSNPVVSALDAERQIRRTLIRYCEMIDRADFDGFASLFERGRWFMVDDPGAQPVRSWLDANIVLHDGQTHTRHEITNLDVEMSDDSRTADFRCYVAIWQHLPGSRSELLVHARFTGVFGEEDGQWWWKTHTMIPDFVGDLSLHMKQ